MKRPIRKWQPEDRPREKCLNQGARQLTTTECLALIIQSGCKSHSAVDVARELLHKYESRLDRLASSEPKEWESAPGIGPAKAARIAAALELARRSDIISAEEIPSIQSSRQAFDLLRSDLGNLDHEEFWVIYLSQANRVQRKMCIGKGGWTQTLADSRVILQQALTHKSTAIIVAHNHPSGRLVPSEADRQLTQRLKSSCKMLDIALLDHLIIGRDDYVSFADSGWMYSPLDCMILHVVGARPQFIKLLPLHRALKARGADQKILHTGQHWEEGMSEVFFEEFGLQADEVLAWQTDHVKMTSAIEHTMLQWSPSTVVVYGDTYSTLCAARAATSLQLPLAHVEAGLRSFNANMPEEYCRVATDRMADWHFAPVQSALHHLIAEGVDRTQTQTLMTGDIMADELIHRPDSQPNSKQILVTLHRNTNVDNPAIRDHIINSLQALTDKGYRVVWPIHPRLRNALNAEHGTLFPKIDWRDPMAREEIIQAIEASEWVITDSGGLQKEAYFLRRPAIILREQTEWVELLNTGKSFLQNPRSEQLATDILTTLVRDCAGEFPPIYGDGTAADQMAAALWDQGPVRPVEVALASAQHPAPLQRYAGSLVQIATGVKVTWTSQGVAVDEPLLTNDWESEAWQDAQIEDLLSQDRILSAMVHMAMRREEYHGNVQDVDVHGRFQAIKSWAGSNGRLDEPVAELWARNWVAECGMDLPKRHQAMRTMVVDVDHATAADGYSWWHRQAAGMKRWIQGRPWRFKGTDPFDAREAMASLFQSACTRWQFFMWLGNRGEYDKGVPGDSAKAKDLTQWIARYQPNLGLHPSYQSRHHAEEHHRFESYVGHRALRQRFHYLKMRLPEDLNALPALQQDWTMSYAERSGYRAGMARPYPWFNSQHPVGEYAVIVPVWSMDQQFTQLTEEDIVSALETHESYCRKRNIPIHVATHWRLFGPNPKLADASAAEFGPWVHALKQWLTA